MAFWLSLVFWITQVGCILQRAVRRDSSARLSGGYVIHLSSGTAAYVAALIIGPRHIDDRRDNRPSNPVAARAYSDNEL